MRLQKKVSKLSILAALIGAASLATGFPLHNQPVAASSASEVVASGLNNPKGIDFGPNGDLYIAEGGTGGEGPCGPGPEGDRCFGPTAAIVRIDLEAGTFERIGSGLPSLASPDGSFGSGVTDISFAGLGNGYFTTGFGGHPADRALFGPAESQLARVGRMNGSGSWILKEDLGEYETEVNPTGDEVDTNPYGILALPGRQVIADAGANALNQITANGNVSTLATFPDRIVIAPVELGFPPDFEIPMDAVPTSVAQGPDGSLYVGQLTGFPFPVGGANIYRVPADGGTPEVFATGFTAVIDVTFGPDGSMYVLEIVKNGLLAGFIFNDWTGALIRVAPDGSRTEVAPGSLFAPGGVTVDSNGDVYVTNKSIFSGEGEVIKIVQ